MGRDPCVKVAVLFIHFDSFGLSCSVLETSAVEMSAFSQYDGTKGHLACEIHLKNSVMSSFM